MIRVGDIIATACLLFALYLIDKADRGFEAKRSGELVGFALPVQP